LVLDGLGHPLELAHLPYRKHRSYEEYLGERGLDRLGTHKWRRRVADVVDKLRAALCVDDVVIGGGNVEHLDAMPPGARRGDNAYAFVGGFRLWQHGHVRV
jgi:polyphosphate glucokinase